MKRKRKGKIENQKKVYEDERTRNLKLLHTVNDYGLNLAAGIFWLFGIVIQIVVLTASIIVAIVLDN